MIQNKISNSPVRERKINKIHHILFKTIYRKKDAYWRGNYLKEHHVFHSLGENCYYQPTVIPADAWMVSMGDNVKIACGVEFITHDILGFMLNGNKRYNAERYFGTHFAPIIIGNDVAIGGGSTVMPGVKIGDNVIVGTRSLVTKDVPDGAIVAGCPVKIIGTVDELVTKRMNMNDFSKWGNATRAEFEAFYFE